MKHRKRKKLVLVLAIGILICVAGGIIGIFRFFPDAVYGFTQMTQNRQKIELKEVSPSTRSFPLSQIETAMQDSPSCLSLIDQDHPVPSDDVKLVPFRDTNLLLRQEVIPSLENLLSASKEQANEKLLIMSSYRTREEQQKLFEEDPETANEPGESEHESGLALDLYVYQYAGKNFIKTETGRWVNEHCQDYGFIIRYPFGKKSVTGFSYEPWHIRYVGLPHSKIIYQNHWTLEEYLKNLIPEKFYSYENHLISRQQTKDGTLKLPENCTEYSVSPDNTGCYVVTAHLTE